MKWYKNTAYTAVDALDKIFNRGFQSDKVIQKLLKTNKKWGSRDRKMVSKALYDIVRWKRKYEYLADDDIKTSNGKWKILAIWSILNNVHIPDWFEIDEKKLKKNIDNKSNLPFPIEASIPDWLYELGKSELGKNKFENEIEALNKEAETVIRVNTLKTNKQELQELLKKNNIESYTDSHYPDALFIVGKPKLTHLKCFKDGLFEIQDASSQLVAEFIQPKQGQTIIDACAGAGGKTLHLAAKMKNKGKIYAFDIYPQKLKELKKRAKRNGVNIIKKTELINPKSIQEHKKSADLLILDVPCSSLGTLKRKPGLKWIQTPQKIKHIKTLQKNILNDYSEMVKVHGYLIYITCSILPSENKRQVEEFLSSNKNFTFVEDKAIMPSESGYDGFYMAKLQRIN
jgi:16S rRNA (cytosine967-C5)-methyltransferase